MAPVVVNTWDRDAAVSFDDSVVSQSILVDPRGYASDPEGLADWVHTQAVARRAAGQRVVLRPWFNIQWGPQPQPLYSPNDSTDTNAWPQNNSPFVPTPIPSAMSTYWAAFCARVQANGTDPDYVMLDNERKRTLYYFNTEAERQTHYEPCTIDDGNNPLTGDDRAFFLGQNIWSYGSSYTDYFIQLNEQFSQEDMIEIERGFYTDIWTPAQQADQQTQYEGDFEPLPESPGDFIPLNITNYGDIVTAWSYGEKRSLPNRLPYAQGRVGVASAPISYFNKQDLPLFQLTTEEEAIYTTTRQIANVIRWKSILFRFNESRSCAASVPGDVHPWVQSPGWAWNGGEAWASSAQLAFEKLLWRVMMNHFLAMGIKVFNWWNPIPEPTGNDPFSEETHAFCLDFFENADTASTINRGLTLIDYEAKTITTGGVSTNFSDLFEFETLYYIRAPSTLAIKHSQGVGTLADPLVISPGAAGDAELAEMKAGIESNQGTTIGTQDMSLPDTTYDTATVLNPSSALSDFTLMVDLSRMSAAWWAAAEDTNARRGRAAKDDGTELPCDWIDYDHAGQTGWLRVKWSGTLATSGTQVLRVYPPVAANSIYTNGSTYGKDNAYDADWIGYWPDAVTDQISGYDGTLNGGMTVGGTVGPAGPATFFDGIDDYVLTDLTPTIADSVTMSAWIKQAEGGWEGVFDDGTGAAISRFGLSTISKVFIRANSTLVYGDTTVPFDTWTHIAASAGPGGHQMYFNGVADGYNAGALTGYTTANPLRIGYFDGSTFTKGEIQHAKYEKTVRSAAWIEQEYDQTNDQAASWGTWTNNPLGSGDPDLTAEYDSSPLADGASVDLGNIVRSDAAQTITITVTNDGDAEATSIVITDGGDLFDTDSGTLGSTLAVDASGTVILDLDISTPGAVSGTVSIASDDPDSPLNFTFSGTVVAPALTVEYDSSPVADGGSIELGSVDQDDTVQVVLSVTNDGIAQATSIVVTDGGDGTVSGGTLGSMLDADATGTVIVTLDTSELGTQSATVAIASSDPASPYNITINFTVEDIMPAPVVINSSPADGVTDTSPDLDAIVLLWIESVARSTGNFLIYREGVLWKTVAASATTIDSFNTNQQTIPLDESPGLGVDLYVLAEASVVVGSASTLPNAAITDPTFLNFTTLSSGPAEISIDELASSGGTIAMGNIAKGATVQQDITVGNAATEPADDLVIGTVVVTGDFTLATNFNGEVIAPGSSVATIVRMDTSAEGEISALVSIPSNDADSPFVINITATVVGARLTLSAGAGSIDDGESVSVGSASVDESLTWTATLQNTGLTTLTIGTPVATGDASIDSESNPAGETLGAGETTTIAMVFDTQAAGALAATLSIPTDDPSSPLEITLTGTVTDSTASTARHLYLTVSECSAILAQLLPSTDLLLRAWNAMTSDDQIISVANASVDFDSVRWDGRVAVAGQTTLWPRVDDYGEAILPNGELGIPDSLGTEAWSFVGLPAAIRMGIALQAAARAAAALRVDTDLDVLARAAAGMLGVSGAGASFQANPIVARMSRSRLHRAVLQLVAAYLPSSVEVV